MSGPYYFLSIQTPFKTSVPRHGFCNIQPKRSIGDHYRPRLRVDSLEAEAAAMCEIGLPLYRYCRAHIHQLEELIHFRIAERDTAIGPIESLC